MPDNENESTTTTTSPESSLEHRIRALERGLEATANALQALLKNITDHEIQLRTMDIRFEKRQK